ncbi:hypothetical protein [Butyrivibrio sp.]|nr:hypothetical protein [Butyrivibrio sp.]
MTVAIPFEAMLHNRTFCNSEEKKYDYHKRTFDRNAEKRCSADE